MKPSEYLSSVISKVGPVGYAESSTANEALNEFIKASGVKCNVRYTNVSEDFNNRVEYERDKIQNITKIDFSKELKTLSIYYQMALFAQYFYLDVDNDYNMLTHKAISEVDLSAPVGEAEQHSIENNIINIKIRMIQINRLRDLFIGFVMKNLNPKVKTYKISKKKIFIDAWGNKWSTNYMLENYNESFLEYVKNTDSTLILSEEADEKGSLIIKEYIDHFQSIYEHMNRIYSSIIDKTTSDMSHVKDSLKLDTLFFITPATLECE